MPDGIIAQLKQINFRNKVFKKVIMDFLSTSLTLDKNIFVESDAIFEKWSKEKKVKSFYTFPC